MKKLVFVLIATVMLSTTIEAKVPTNILNKNKLENVNCLKRIKIDMTLTDDAGGTWQVTGYVDVGLLGGINGYDITLTHGGHSYHFHGKMTRTVNKDGSFSTSVEGDLTENDKIIEMTPLINSVLIKCDNQVIKENKL